MIGRGEISIPYQNRSKYISVMYKCNSTDMFTIHLDFEHHLKINKKGRTYRKIKKSFIIDRTTIQSNKKKGLHFKSIIGKINK